MSKRILELRNDNSAAIRAWDQSDSIQKMENNLNLVLTKQLEYYVQK
jgi:hypothetical protein